MRFLFLFISCNLLFSQKVSVHPLDTIPPSSNYFVGSFMPNDNWIVYGTPHQTLTTSFKYYSKGTFHNRFSQFAFNEYLQQKFKTAELIREIRYLNTNTGKALFFNNDIDYLQQKYYIYSYDFINDQLEVVLDLNEKYLPEILDYHESTNQLLLSNEPYHPNYSNPQNVYLIQNKTSIQLNGKFKHVKFSTNGKFILTINESDLLEIIDTQLNHSLTYKLIPGTYTVNSWGEANFLVSNTHHSSLPNRCLKETIVLNLDQNNQYQTETKDCSYVTHLVNKKDAVAIYLEDVGLVINQKKMPLIFTNPPKAISFNDDTSKIMISFHEGKIGIYDTTTFEELGGMYHPSQKEHLFYSSNGFYFSNTNAEQFLYATSNNKRIQLSTVDSQVFNPIAVLNIFGKPDANYVAILKKAIELRKDKKDLDVNFSQNSSNSIEPVNTNRQTGTNLYVLTIGVADYIQSEYNLTFADKDALDIADLYGKLDTETELYYQKKFFGNRFTLQFLNRKFEYRMKRHLSTDLSLGNWFTIQNDNTKWLEIRANEALIWDFKSEKIEPIQLPNGFHLDFFSKENSVFFHPDSNKFYVRDGDFVFYQYDKLTSSFQRTELPFKVKDYYSNFYQPINNEQWVYIEDMQDGTYQLSMGKCNSTNLELFTFDLKIFYDYNRTTLLNSDPNYSPQFKCISSKGDQIIYTLNNEIFLIDSKNNATPIRLPIVVDSSDDIAISATNTLSILHSTNGNYQNHITVYSFDGTVLETSSIEEGNQFNTRGISIHDANPCWIKESKGILESNYFTTSNNLARYNPFSFQQVNVASLINNQATAQAVKEKFPLFFKGVKPEDEVIVFLAGHGVLDANNKYYFAPHDMDFNQISKKGIGFEFLIEQLKSLPTKNKLLLMDTCHSGNTLDLETSTNSNAAEKGNMGVRGSISKGINQKTAFKLSDVVYSVFDNFLSTSGVTILSASSGGDVAYENENLGNGAFTTAYLKVLREKMTYLVLREENTKRELLLNDDIIAKIMSEVANLTHGKQIPDIREINSTAQIKLW